MTVPDELAVANQLILSQDWEKVFEWACDHHDRSEISMMDKVTSCYYFCMQHGMPKAALNLGTFYYSGRFFEQDYQRAFELYKIAADVGEPRAICNCGYCFYYGRHQEVDFAEAYKYFSLGALLYDDANCLYKLGDMFLNGYAVEKNEAHAFQLYLRALDQAQMHDDQVSAAADAQYRIGKCYLRGIGTEKDVEEAHVQLSFALLNFYKRRKTDGFASGLIQKTKELIAEAQAELDAEKIL